MNFIKTIANSIYSPSFYAKIPKKSFRSSLLYFSILSLILTAITLVQTKSLIFLRDAPKEAKEFLYKIESYYPDNLEVKIQKGKVISNVKEPYFVPLPPDGYTLTKNQEVTNIVVIDTKTPFTLAKFREYKTSIWITEDIIFYQGDKGEIKTFDLTKVSDMTINKNQIKSLVTKFEPWIVPILYFFSFLAFIVVYFSLLFRLVYLLLLAFIIRMVGKITKHPLTYKDAYKTGLFAMTLGLVLGTLNYLHPGLPHFPFMFTAVTLSITFVNLKKQQE